MEDDKSAKEAKKKPEKNEKSKETDDEIPTSTKTLVLKAPKIPTSIQRLQQQALNLNLPPDNWLRATQFENLDGFNSKGYTDSKFSSIGMAFDHLYKYPEVDVVTAANNIKKLLTLALTTSQGLSMFVHPVGKSLLIDNFDIHKWLLNPQPQWKWMREFFFSQVLGKECDLNKAIMRKSHTNEALMERNLMSKLLYYSLVSYEETETDTENYENNPLVPTESHSHVKVEHSPVKVENSAAPTTSQENVDKNRFPVLPEPVEMLRIAMSSTGTKESPTSPKVDDRDVYVHNRTLLWNFKDLKCLIGSDLPIFGDEDHPCVSLKLVNVKKPINILTGLDYWLDNLMCQVPEVLMCFHDEGIVKNYEFFKTEDIPNLSPNARFNAESVSHVAMNILSFLKRNATKEGHTYWLFKRKNDPVVKLYDLTSLCETQLSTDETVPEDFDEKSPNPDKPLTTKTPFQDPVSMLLYKLARNIIKTKRNGMNMPPGLPLKGEQLEKDLFNIGDEDAIANKALKSCLKILDKEKYPQIAASSYYLLSDIYIPDDTNPLCPKFSSGQDTPEPQRKKKKKKNKSKSKNKRAQNDAEDKKASGNVGGTNQQENIASVTVPELHEKKNEEKDPGDEDPNIDVEPMPLNVKKRCAQALLHICDGLQSVKNLQLRKDEMAAKQRKAREQHERDNPKMCKPTEPIPMPYKNNPDDNKIEMYHGQKKIDWHDNLKALLVRKAFLVYVTLAEAFYSEENYGQCVKLLKRALNCYFCFLKISDHAKASNVKMLLSFAYGVAGDVFMVLAEKWDEMWVKFHEGFNNQGSEVDKEIAKAVEDIVDESMREWTLKVPKDIEEGLLLTLKCFRAARDIYDTVEDQEIVELKDDLLGRYGNALNTTATLYIRKATSFLEDDMSLLEIEEFLHTASSLLEQAEKCFTVTNNWLNNVIVHSNLGVVHRTWAHAIRKSKEPTSLTSKEPPSDLNWPPIITPDEQRMHQKAIDFYLAAYEYIRGKNVMEDMKLNTVFNLTKTVLTFMKEMFERNIPLLSGDLRSQNDIDQFLAPVFKLDLLRPVLGAAIDIAKDSNIADNADGYFRKLADCIIEIEITVFQNFALICQLLTKNQAFEIASEMRRLAISATFFRQTLKQAEDSFIAWSLNFIFEVMEDHIKPELNPNPYIRLCKTLASYGMYFVSPALMETKDFKNEPLPFVPKEELCELKNMTDYICKMIAVCVCFPEKGSDRLEKVTKDGCVTKEKFDYAYSLTVVLQLIIKYFSDAWNWLLRSDMKNEEASNWLKERIKYFKRICENPKGIHGGEVIKGMDYAMNTLNYFLLETIQDQEKKKLFFENYTEAVMNNAKRLHSFPDTNTETDLEVTATEEIRENS